MPNTTQKMSHMISAFSAWAGRGLRQAKVTDTPLRDETQEFETAVPPVIPARDLPQSVHANRPTN
jgi:hypothetical protein